jgi:hypothetical protein
MESSRIYPQQADSKARSRRRNISLRTIMAKSKSLAKQTARATGITGAGDDDGNFACRRGIMISRRDAPE